MEKTRQERCKYAHSRLNNGSAEFYCVVDGEEDDEARIVTEEDCEKCEKFESRYIEFPLTINGIKNEDIYFSRLIQECGGLCAIRPCGDEYEGKSYIGIYLGELPRWIHTRLDEETGILTNSTINNPAIFVPELKKIIFGSESWWRTIDSKEDFKEITDEDIENVWYVKILKALEGRTE